jgi:hypothetical protein
VRGSRLPRRSDKGDTSETKVFNVSLSAWVEIKVYLYRGVSESLESTSACIGVIGKSLKPHEKNPVYLLLFSTNLFAIPYYQ